jgi:hypothetical protein
VVALLALVVVAEHFVLADLLLERYALHGCGEVLEVLRTVNRAVQNMRTVNIFIRHWIKIVVGVGFEARPLGHVPLHGFGRHVTARWPLRPCTLIPTTFLHELLPDLFHVDVVEGLEVHVCLGGVALGAVCLVHRGTVGALRESLLIIQLLRLVHRWLLQLSALHFTHTFHHVLVLVVVHRETRSSSKVILAHRLQFVLLTLYLVYFQFQVIDLGRFFVYRFVEGAGLLDFLELDVDAFVLLLLELTLQEGDLALQSFDFFQRVVFEAVEFDQ